jgi:alkylated DNA repair dioxygenase AlkB
METLVTQASLFGAGEPRLDPRLPGLRRLLLSDTAWIDHLPSWLEGHDALFELLRRTTRWEHHRRRMYERVVDVPRLVAELPEDGPGHPVLYEARDALSRHYGLRLPNISLAYYRDGRDSVAWHGNRLGRLVDDTVVAILSLGEPRRFLLRPAAGGPSRAFELGWGDLLVMGGSCQRTWQHAVPKVALAGPRMSVQFRPDVVDQEP